MGGGSSSSQLSSASGNIDVSNGGIVQADPSTNSLIITAPEPIYRNLRSIIEKLDVRRAQVFVESLIVEVSTDKAAEFGIQFQGLSGVGADGDIAGVLSILAFTFTMVTGGNDTTTGMLGGSVQLLHQRPDQRIDEAEDERHAQQAGQGGTQPRRVAGRGPPAPPDRG